MDALLEMSRSATESAGLPPSDEVLMDDYRRTGRRAAFEELVHRYERELFSYLCRYLGDAEAAEDVFQATFLQVHLKKDQYETGRRFRPWLYAVATNQAIDSQRRERRHRHASLDQPGSGEDHDLGKLVDLLVSHGGEPLDQANANECRVWMREAVDKLPDALRDVVNLVYYQDLKYREAAEALNLPVGTVKSRMHLAIIKLQEILKSTYANEV